MEDFYKYNRAFLIRFRKFDEGKVTYLKNYVFPNLTMLLEEDILNVIAIEEDELGQDNLVLFIEEIKINEFVEFCRDEDIVEEYRDITKDLLYNDNLDDVIRKMIVSDEFEEKFNRFFSKNLTLDVVLDKISLFGKKTLTELEKKVLHGI